MQTKAVFGRKVYWFAGCLDSSPKWLKLKYMCVFDGIWLEKKSLVMDKPIFTSAVNLVCIYMVSQIRSRFRK
jgi:hypothetical protein